jgi:hypothetical protein
MTRGNIRAGSCQDEQHKRYSCCMLTSLVEINITHLEEHGKKLFLFGLQKKVPWDARVEDYTLKRLILSVASRITAMLSRLALRL